MKKLKYLLFLFTFLFISTINVNALNLGAPQTYTYFSDGSEIQGTATSIGYWGSENYWQSNSKLGSFTSSSPTSNSVQFFWNSANLCQNKDISISGTIAVLSNFFTEQTYNARIVMNGENLACSFTQENSSRIRYTCFGYGGGHFQIFFEETSFYGQYRNYDIAVSKSVDLSCDVSNQAIVNQSIQNTQDIINNQNSNTNTIIQNQDTNTQNIINNQNTNTQDIINNQNTNTQQQIESEKVCKEYTFNNSVPKSDGYLNSSGNVISSTNLYHTTNYIPINKNETYFLDLNYSLVSSSYCLYDTDKNLLSCSPYNSRTSITIVPSSDGYIRYSLSMKESNYVTTFRGNTCTNGNQALDDSINNLNDSITSEDSPNTNQDISDMNDMIASDTPITDLLTLPMTLINAYYTGITSSCSPYNFGSLLGTDIVFPCINLEQRLGSNLWLIIDSLCSIFLIYSIAMLFVHAFDSLTSLKDDFDDMYVPRHAGKHVGSGING